LVKAGKQAGRKRVAPMGGETIWISSFLSLHDNPSFILSRRSIKGMGLSKAPVILFVLGSLDPLAKPEVNAYG
jgi:hypothetical protein